jgi:glycosyltransferase involved in cell wall biosynthesis
MDKLKKIIVVMPAFNAEKTLVDTYNKIPCGIVDETILVDDFSKDGTVKLAKELNIKVIAHPHNVGYGGNQKTCYMEAIRDNADIVIMLHPDGQYDPSIIPDMVKKIIEEDVDIVLGSRFLIQGGALAGGMPLYKFVANRILSNMQNFFLGLSLSEYHTGYRAYKIDFLKKVPFMRNSNDFDFDSQILIQGKVFGFKFGEVPVKTRYFKEASSVNFFVSMRYGIKTLKILFEYMLFKLKLYKPSIFI